MAKEKGDFAESIREICRVVQGPVSAEVLAIDADEHDRRGHARWPRSIRTSSSKCRSPLPACAPARRLSTAGHRVNVTLVFSPTQALIAAKVGAAFVSPFIGRLDDIATDGMELIRQIVEIYRNYDFRTEILVASVRHPMHIVEAARLGADVCTCPPAVLDACFKHPLTDLGLEKFLSDWKKSKEVMADRLSELERLAELGGGEERLRKQHEAGKLTARERVDLLFDAGTFEELDKLVTHRCLDFGMEKELIPGDGVVAGHGRVDGRPVYAFAQDFTVFGGSLSETNAAENRQGHGSGDADGRADRGSERFGWRAHSGRRDVARAATRRFFCATRSRPAWCRRFPRSWGRAPAARCTHRPLPTSTSWSKARATCS